MQYSVEVSVAPSVEPISRASAKLHLREDLTEQDELIDALIVAAREWTENYCRRSWVKRTLVLRLDGFPGEIRLPRGPVLAVASVQYTDANGATQSVGASGYQVDTYRVPGRIVLAFGSTWPTPKVGTVNAVQVTYTAGYAPDDSGSPTDFRANVPKAAVAAMKLLISHLYEHRDAVAERAQFEVPFAVKALLAPLEIRDFTLE